MREIRLNKLKKNVEINYKSGILGIDHPLDPNTIFYKTN
jgi:hypothetical protein